VKRRIAITAVFLGSLFCISWLAAWLMVGSGVPRNTHVLGVEIGARSQTDAIRILRARFSADLAKPIDFETVGKLHQVNQETLGATFDVAATVSAGGNRPINPFLLFARVFSVVDVQPVIKIDQARFTQAIDDLAQRSEVPMLDGGIAFKGVTPVAIWSSDGEAIDKAKALAVFRAQWLRSPLITLPALYQRAHVTTKEIIRAIQEIAAPAVSAPITLAIDGHDLLISPTSLASSITFIADANGDLSPRLSSDVLSHSLGSAWLKLVPPAKDAVFKFVNDQPRVYPSSLGRTISDDSLTQALTPILTASGAARRAVIATTVLQPRISTQKIGGLGISAQITKFTTNYPYAAYRIQNIHRAADLIDGTIVQPDAIFSLNKTVGQRTAENGFAEGIVIYNGRFAKDFGGGVSQVATTTWNAAWFSGVDLVEHMAHSFYISRYPAGREATVAWPSLDLKFRNDTGHVLLVHATYTNSSLTISIYGTRKYDVGTITGPRKNFTNFAVYDDDTPTCIRQDGVVGFDIDVTRVLKTAGVEVSREVFHTHYVPEDRITCTNPAAAFGN
jgi:vancomycin resistance protein YoaR